MTGELSRARWEIVEAGGRTAQSFGLNPLLGQIYVLLYLSADPYCLDDVAHLLGVSKASISIACRQLESWGMLKRIWKRGDRRSFYEAELEMSNLINNGLLAPLNKKLESARVQIARSLEFANQEEGESAQFLKKRLQEAEKRRGKVSALINNPLLKSLM